MAKKPTYEELEQKVRDLEKEAVEAGRLEERSRLLSLAIEQSSEGIAVVDMDGNLEHLNDAFAQMHGYSAEELIGKNLSIFHTPHQMPSVEAANLQLTESGEFKGEIWHVRRDGTIFPTFMHNALVRDDAGKPIGMIGTVRDITDMKQADNALRESEERHRLFFENCPIGMIHYTSEGTVTAVNDAMIATFGSSRDKLIGLNIHDIPDERLSEAVSKSLNGELGYYEGEYTSYTGGRSSIIKNTSIPIIRNGGVIAGVGIIEDITERRQMDDLLRESEDKFRSFAEQSLVGIYLISGDVFKYVNPKFAEIFGYSVDECLDNMHFPQLVHPEDLATVEKQVGRRLSGETKSVRYSFRGIKKSGETIHVEIFGSSMFLKGKTVATGTMLDITERKRAQEELLNQKYFLQKAQEIGQIGTWELDIKKGELLWTDETYRIFGLPIGTKLTYEIFLDCVHPDDREYVDKEWNAALDKKPYDIEHRLLVDGHVKWVREKAELQFNEKDECIRGTGFAQDITERKKAEEEQNRLEDQLQKAQKMEAMGLMAGGIAHDLNNILSGIVSYPELLLMDLPEDSPLRKPIKTIQESGMRAADVVEDLLTIARGVATGKEALNLNTLITEYLESTEYQTLEKTRSFVNLKTELDPDLLNMSGSPTHINKTLMNLVANASEAIEGSGTVTISTTNRYLDEPLKGYEDVRAGEYAVLRVSDDGSGIIPKDLERIFEPFYTKKVMGRSGTGLGLAVVWNTVQDHNGYVNVNTSEKGTVFELYFPVIRDEVAVEKEKVPLEDYLGHGEKILVVDDEERQIEIASGMLTKLGYNPEAVSSGEEAIQYMKENSVDLIVLDMVMPKGINGRETYEQIIKIRPGQKAVIASGYAKTKEVETAQKLGAGKYIKKPYILEKLGLAVKEELEK